MAIIEGFNGSIIVSGDGEVNWFPLDCVLSKADIDETTETKTRNTFCQRGNVSEIPKSKKRTYSIEGVYNPSDTGTKILETKYDTKEMVSVKHYPNKTDPNLYSYFRGYITSLKKAQSTDEDVTLTVEIGIDGQTYQSVNAY